MPTNDNVANAELISGPNWSASGTTAGATVESGEPQNGSVWYVYTPSANGTFALSLSNTSLTYIEEYVGPAGAGSYASLAATGNTVVTGGPGTLFSNVQSGATYYYRVVTFGSSFNAAQISGPDGLSGAPCFCAGTMIKTLRGETAVEALVPGDVLVLASGAVEVVRFVGVSTVPSVNGRYKADRLPVVIRQGALGENLPNADLRLAPGHAIAHGDLLVPARRLVNGTTITIDAAPVDLKYYHVRLDRHEVLVSNGVASESFKHDPKWAAFDNAADYAERFPLDAAMTEAECRLAHREAGRRVTAKYPAPRDLLAVIAQRAEVLTGEQAAVQAA